MMPKKHLYYFYDEVNDDFAKTDIAQLGTPSDWEYLPKSKVYIFFNTLFYYTLILICKFAIRCCMGVKIKNKKVVKKAKKQGFFIYANHTSYFLDAITGHVASLPKRTYVVVNPDAINIKGLRWLTKGMGALPLPNTKSLFVNYLNAIEKINKKKRVIVIYPEAHIWPKYNKIRNFPAGSFGYPAKINAPCFCKTTVYETLKKGKTKPTIYYDGPFYPNMELQYKERQQDLRDRIYNQMVERAKKSMADANFIYTKVDKKEDMKMIIED